MIIVSIVATILLNIFNR
ncbi:hypothetical protein [Psychrobacter alimentarius]|nr:hypothetical protein [Psychrobacter alimentarius]